MSSSVQPDQSTELAKRFNASWPIDGWRDSKTVVAVSGGPDSVALLRLLRLQISAASQPPNLIVAHCNHQTRDRSDRDEEFVTQLADELKLPLVVTRRDGQLENHEGCEGDSEEAMRKFRYRSLVSVAHQFGARYIATGHTLDDQVETILFRLFRGTGIAGLSGINKIRVIDGVSVVRPMLGMYRYEIVQLLQELKQDYVVDESNCDNSFSRNFIRNEILPMVEKKFGRQVYQSLNRVGKLALDYEALLSELTRDFVPVLVDSEKNIYDCGKLIGQPLLLIQNSIKQVWRQMQLPEQEMTQKKWESVANLILAKNDGKIQLPGRVTVSSIGTNIRIEMTAAFRRSGENASN